MVRAERWVAVAEPEEGETASQPLPFNSVTVAFQFTVSLRLPICKRWCVGAAPTVAERLNASGVTEMVGVNASCVALVRLAPKMAGILTAKGAENSTGFWTLYSSGSYGNSGIPAEGIGSKPIPMSAYEKIFLGWSDYTLLGYGQKDSLKLGTSN